MWKSLKANYSATKDRRFSTLVDAERANDFSASTGDLHFDYSKTNIDVEARDLLIELLNE